MVSCLVGLVLKVTAELERVSKVFSLSLGFFRDDRALTQSVTFLSSRRVQLLWISVWEWPVHIVFSALWWEPRLPGPLRWGRMPCCPPVSRRGDEMSEEWRMCVDRVDMWPWCRLQRWNRWEGSYCSFRHMQRYHCPWAAKGSKDARICGCPSLS